MGKPKTQGPRTRWDPTVSWSSRAVSIFDCSSPPDYASPPIVFDFACIARWSSQDCRAGTRGLQDQFTVGETERVVLPHPFYSRIMIIGRCRDFWTRNWDAHQLHPPPSKFYFLNRWNSHHFTPLPSKAFNGTVTLFLYKVDVELTYIRSFIWQGK